MSNNASNKPVLMIGGGPGLSGNSNHSSLQNNGIMNANGANKNDRFKKQPK